LYKPGDNQGTNCIATPCQCHLQHYQGAAADDDDVVVVDFDDDTGYKLD